MLHDHLANHIHKPELRSDNTLHVVGVISNPVRYQSRYRLFREWYKKMQETANVKVYVVEIAFGDRQHEVTSATNPHHLQLRTSSEIWLKENMINLGVRHLLPKDWKYLCWSDCDVFWADPNWAKETIHQLQHFQVVQPWQSAINLGPTGNVIRTFESVGKKVQDGIDPKAPYNGDPYRFGHTGYAWAATRLFWENIEGLIDFGILGSGDHHMALAMRGLVENSVHGKMSGGFMRRCYEWQTRAFRVTNGIIGFTPGRVEHEFHGPMARRYYNTRWEILVKNGFDPDKDLMRDAQGLYKLIGKPGLEQEIKLYNRSRHEDSIEET